MSDGLWLVIGIAVGGAGGAVLVAWLVASVAVWLLDALRARFGLRDE